MLICSIPPCGACLSFGLTACGAFRLGVNFFGDFLALLAATFDAGSGEDP